jgi:hypothetical protein
MVNNSTYIVYQQNEWSPLPSNNKMNDPLFPQTTEYIKDHNKWHWKSQSWLKNVASYGYYAKFILLWMTIRQLIIIVDHILKLAWLWFKILWQCVTIITGHYMYRVFWKQPTWMLDDKLTSCQIFEGIHFVRAVDLFDHSVYQCSCTHVFVAHQTQLIYTMKPV